MENVAEVELGWTGFSKDREGSSCSPRHGVRRRIEGGSESAGHLIYDSATHLDSDFRRNDVAVLRSLSFCRFRVTICLRVMKSKSHLSRLMLALSLIAFAFALAVVIATFAESGASVDATDATPSATPTPSPTATKTPSPVNPPGPIPTELTDSAGNLYEVFTPEEGGTLVIDDYSIVARPGRCSKRAVRWRQHLHPRRGVELGLLEHRYTLGGSYYAVDVVDEDGEVPSPPFRFNRPPVVCVPMPNEFLPNIDDVALIATDETGSTQTVLNSRTTITSDGLKVCGYLGTLPAVVAVGRKGSPGPLPTPEPSPQVEEQLPATGGSAPHFGLAVIWLLMGTILASAAFLALRRTTRGKS